MCIGARWRIEAEGHFDFAAWNQQVDILKRHGLKWVPFLIAGPAYSLPDWFRGSAEHRGAVCLEHGLSSKIQSIFDRSFDCHIDRFVGAFAERYRGAEVIEALLLGITGDFGEAIYPVTGTMWTQVAPGPYHTHPGYWCGDPRQPASFARPYSSAMAKTSQPSTQPGEPHSRLNRSDAPGTLDSGWDRGISCRRADGPRTIPDPVCPGSTTVARLHCLVSWLDGIAR